MKRTNMDGKTTSVVMQITDYDEKENVVYIVADATFTIRENKLHIVAYNPANNRENIEVDIPIKHNESFALKINKKSVSTSSEDKLLKVIDEYKTYTTKLFHTFVKVTWKKVNEKELEGNNMKQVKKGNRNQIEKIEEAKVEEVKKATWERNEEHAGIEVTFTDKPSADVRKMLKAFGFRWHSAKKLWYAKENEERVRIATIICESVA